MLIKIQKIWQRNLAFASFQLLIMKDGQLQEQLVGLQCKEALATKLDATLA